MFMDNFMKEELEEALRAITSSLRKSEKAVLKLKEGTFQHRMIVQAIKDYYIAIELINRELETNITETLSENQYTKEESDEGLQAFTSAISRVEKILPKFKTGTSQHTLAIRRIKAFHIAIELINRESKKCS
jgi:uncharacterized protein (UPF0332 family)